LILTIDTDSLERGDLDQIREVLKLALMITEAGIQMSLLPVEQAAPFDRNEKMPDGPVRWLTIQQAAPLIGWSEAYLYKNFRKHRLGIRVNGRVYIDRKRVAKMK
jgi:hypothetical protein